MIPLTPQERAQRATQAMWAGDQSSAWLGMTFDSIAPGAATMTMRVTENHLNGHKICHGGFIFTLADSAFAFACNSYNERVVAQYNSITYISPVTLDEVLIATAREISKTARNGIYDVEVVTSGGRTVAQFRGHCRVIEGRHFSENKD